MLLHVSRFISECRSVMSDSLRPHGLYSPWNSPGQNTAVGSLSLLQGIFLTQGSNLCLLNCRWILHLLSHLGGPIVLSIWQSNMHIFRVRKYITIVKSQDLSGWGNCLQRYWENFLSNWKCPEYWLWCCYFMHMFAKFFGLCIGNVVMLLHENLYLNKVV